MDESDDRILESLCQIQVSLENLRVTIVALDKNGADHEHRLRELERWHHCLSPVLTWVGFLCGGLMTCLLQYVLNTR